MWPHVLKGVGLKYLYFAFKMCSTRKDWHVSPNGMLFIEMNGANCKKVMLRIISTVGRNLWCSFTFMSCRVYSAIFFHSLKRSSSHLVHRLLFLTILHFENERTHKLNYYITICLFVDLKPLSTVPHICLSFCNNGLQI